jgi:hypothetical protein
MAIAGTIRDLKLIGIQRAGFKKKRKLNGWDVLKIQQFSLVHDLKRFYSFIINGRRNQFEKY